MIVVCAIDTPRSAIISIFVAARRPYAVMKLELDT
jgi:hypothetical protein